MVIVAEQHGVDRPDFGGADRRLGQAQVGEERGLLRPRELRDLRLDHRGDPAEARGRARRHRLEPEALHERGPARDLLLGQVQAVEDGLLGQEGEAAEGPRLVVAETLAPGAESGLGPGGGVAEEVGVDVEPREVVVTS